MRLGGAWVMAALYSSIALPAIAAGGGGNVLVLYSNGRLLPANIEFDRGLREMFPATDGQVRLFDEFLDVPRFGGQAHARTVSTYLREKYAAQPPDVVVVAGDDALRFLLVNRTEIFPRVPVVSMGVSMSFLRSLPQLPGDVTGVPVKYDCSATIDRALRLHPRARRLVLVTGSSIWDREWEARLRDEASRFTDRVTLEFLAGLPTGAVLKRLGELGEEAVVFTPGYFQDGESRAFIPRQAVQAMAAAATAPVYGPYYTFLGTGVVGGYMPSLAAAGRQAGQIVKALLDGVAPNSVRLPEILPTPLNIDWRQVRRWGIDRKAIPADAIVHFREPAFPEAYKDWAIAAVILFLLLGGLIAWLLLEHRRRRLAELAVQTHRFELSHASRLAIAGELTGAIAHEINQPLGAILSNADAADLILESGADRRGELRAILADIRRDDLRASEVIRRLRKLLAKHEVERHPFDLNEAVSEVGAILRSEAKRRRVALDVRPASTAVELIGDRIQIQQVLINLVLNAIDAVADATEEQRRAVVVSVEKPATGVTVAVRDRGPGIKPEHLSKIFGSFFSTKRTGMGLGLSIARTLVEAHGGRIRAENGPGEGAVFIVEFPAPAGTDIPAPRQA